ncbi:MAG: histidine phosphatase family protein [Propionibacteriaceae bacterium]|nr:histidine phosphatase family protein [Propionibacteriaceae bacterium]
MKTLIVLRHAKSSWQTSDADHERPLSDRGLQDAAVAGKILSEYHIDYLLSSTATRAKQTWEQAQTGGASADVAVFSKAIYHAWPDEIISELRELDASVRVALLIGHQPTLGDLVASLTSPNQSPQHLGGFPTCALAVLNHPGEWQTLAEGSATLARFEIPRADQ